MKLGGGVRGKGGARGGEGPLTAADGTRNYGNYRRLRVVLHRSLIVIYAT